MIICAGLTTIVLAEVDIQCNSKYYVVITVVTVLS